MSWWDDFCNNWCNAWDNVGKTFQLAGENFAKGNVLGGVAQGFMAVGSSVGNAITLGGANAIGNAGKDNGMIKAAGEHLGEIQVAADEAAAKGDLFGANLQSGRMIVDEAAAVVGVATGVHVVAGAVGGATAASAGAVGANGAISAGGAGFAATAKGAMAGAWNGLTTSAGAKVAGLAVKTAAKVGKVIPGVAKTPGVVRAAVGAGVLYEGATDVITIKDNLFTQDNFDDLSKEMEEYERLNPSAYDQRLESFKTFRESYKNGEISDDVIAEMCEYNDLDKDVLLAPLNMSQLELEENSFYKSDLSNVSTVIPSVASGEATQVTDDLKLSRLSDGRYHCESEYLGTFDYDPKEWQVGYKTVTEDDGSESKLPVLEFCGSDTRGQKSNAASIAGIAGLKNEVVVTGWDPINIPDGVKSLDYTFANHENLDFLPDEIPDSVTSMHCTFENCKKAKMYDVEKTLTLPDGCEDMSRCFKNCYCLQGNIDFPKDLKNTTEAMAQCASYFSDIKERNDALEVFFSGQTYKKTGKSADISQMGAGFNDFLAAENAVGMWDGIPDRLHKYTTLDGAVANMSFAINDGKLNENIDWSKYDESDYKTSQATSLSSKEGTVMSGDVITNQSLINGQGVLTDHAITVTGKDGKEHVIDDATGLKKSHIEVNNNAWESWLINGATGFGLYAITKKLTKSTIGGLVAGVGGTLLLSKTGVLGNSIYPVVKWTANLLPEGSKLKESLNNFATKLNGYSEAENKAIDEYNKKFDDQYTVGSEWKDARLSRLFGQANDSLKYGGDYVGEYMSNNAKECSRQMTFMAVAMNGESGADVVNSTIEETVSSMEKYWHGKTGVSKEEMQNYYVNVFEGLERYNQGAKQGNAEYYGNDKLKKDLSGAGLDIVNRSYVDSVMNSLTKMNDEYGFMDDATWKRLENMDISGVDIKNIRNYDENYMSRIAESSKSELATLQKEFAASRAGMSTTYGKDKEDIGVEGYDADTNSGKTDSKLSGSTSTKKSNNDYDSDDGLFDGSGSNDGEFSYC